MRRIALVVVLVLVAVSVTVEAWSSGPPASNVVSGDGCTCHSQGPNAGTSVTVEAPTAYVLGQSYTIKVSSTTDVTSVGLNKGGFLSWASAGTLQKPATNANWYQTEPYDSRPDAVIKHTTAGDQGNTAQAWEYVWKAPSTSVGSVQIKVWVNRVNGDGGASEADHWNRKHVTVAAPATSAPTSTTPSGGTSSSSPTSSGTSPPQGQDTPSDGAPALPWAAAVAVLAAVAFGRRRS
ncbi:MAG: hypothetical protein HYT80_10510 [Euryarchaeota archaeon]|nr:hypothetical protein [Euryarchaeota archaeon]